MINPADINKKQMKLLETMIKKLFPEFLYVKVDEYQIDGGHPTVIRVSDRNAWPVFCFLSEIKEAPHDDCRAIPWFEFCFNHLIPKLKLKPLWTDNIYEDCFIKSIHPINYLFINFQNL